MTQNPPLPADAVFQDPTPGDPWNPLATFQDLTPADPWQGLQRLTQARIALGRTGHSLPTRPWLEFATAHAQARDAVHEPLDWDALIVRLRADGWGDPLLLRSQAPDRSRYLMRPDWGRRLHPHDAQRLAHLAAAGSGHAPDLVLVVGDGLSSRAIAQHAPALLQAIGQELGGRLRLGPLVLVQQARVAVGDEVGALLGAGMVAVLIGERPGLSSPDSVGIYLTHTPRIGCTDAQRNCISNVRPQGQPPAQAARRLAWLIRQARLLGCTGVGLKDASDTQSLPAADPPAALDIS